MLRPGGTFLTQQRGVGGNDLLERFGRPPVTGPSFDLAFAVGQLRTAGLEIVRAEEATTPMTFLDVGAFVYFVRAAPWVLPDLDVVEDRGPLEAIHDVIGRDGGFEVQGTHMLITCPPRLSSGHGRVGMGPTTMRRKQTRERAQP